MEVIIPVPSIDRTIFHELGHLIIGEVLHLEYENTELAITIHFSQKHVTYLNTEYDEASSREKLVKLLLVSLGGEILEEVIIGNIMEEGLKNDHEYFSAIEDIIKRIHGKKVDRIELSRICRDIFKNYNQEIIQLYNHIKNKKSTEVLILP